MVTWQSLSQQAEQLPWRDRLALIWRLARSLFGRSSSAAEVAQSSDGPKSVAEALEGKMGVITLNFQQTGEATNDVWLEKHLRIRETAGKPWGDSGDAH